MPNNVLNVICHWKTLRQETKVVHYNKIGENETSKQYRVCVIRRKMVGVGRVQS